MPIEEKVRLLLVRLLPHLDARGRAIVVEEFPELTGLEETMREIKQLWVRLASHLDDRGKQIMLNLYPDLKDWSRDAKREEDEYEKAVRLVQC